MIRLADEERKVELEAWLDVSESTDADDATDFTASDQGQFFMKKKE